MSFPSGWAYYKSHTITGSTAGAQTNYQVGIKVYYGSGTDGTETVNGVTFGKVYCNSHCNSDFSDIRFTNSAGSLLPNWIEYLSNSNFAIVWVQVDSIPASPSTCTIQMYYGNPGATSSLSNGSSTFIAGSDFNGSSLDSGWTSAGTGTVTVAGGYVEIAATASWGQCRVMETADRDMSNKRIIHRWRPITGASQTNQIIYAASDLSGNPYWFEDGIRASGDSDGDLYSLQSGVWALRYTTGNNYSVNNWYREQILVTSTTIQVFKGSDAFTNLDQSSAISYDSISAKRVQFGMGDNTAKGDWDYIWFAKYCSPEPSQTAWGTEETTDLVVIGNLTVDGNATVKSDLDVQGNGKIHFGIANTASDTLLWRTNPGELSITNDAGSTYANLKLNNLTSAGNATISNILRLPCQISPGTPPDLVGWVWHYTSGIWDPQGMPMGSTPNYLSLQHPTLLDPNNDNQPYYTDWTLAMLNNAPRTDYPYWPIMYTHSALLVQRDFTAGGFIASEQGACSLGYGLNKRYMPPMIWLPFSSTPVLNLKSPSNPTGILNGDGSNLPSQLNDAELYYYTGSGNATFPLSNHLYEFSNSPSGHWIDMGSQSDFSGYYDTLHILKNSSNVGESYITWLNSALGNLKCANITAVGTSTCGIAESNDGILSLHGGYAGWASPTSNPMIYLATGGDYGPYNTLEIRKISSTDWAWGDLACGQLIVNSVANTTARGPLYLTSSGTIGYNTSSRRFKENIQDLPDCTWLYNLRPVTFDWKEAQRKQSEGRQIGLIAEEVNQQCPQLVSTNNEGKPEGVHYEWLGIPLVVEVKKLRNRIEALENYLKQN